MPGKVDSPMKPSLLYATAPAMGTCLSSSQTPFAYWAAVPGLLPLQGDMFWKAIVFDIWLCFSLLGKSSRPLLSRELGLLYCPEQSSGVSKAAQARARLPDSPGSCPSALLERHWDELDRQHLLAGACGLFAAKQTAHLGLALAATVESSCSCERNLPWV